MDMLRSLNLNAFDAVVYACFALGILMGFSAGLLRSLATIIGYLIAAPVAVGLTPFLSQVLTEQFNMPPTQVWLLFVGIFLVVGIVLSALLRLAISEMVGVRISLPDRLVGALLGAVRMALLAVLMVLIFDRIIPFDRQPSFLTGSKLRPILSKAGQAGVKSLPPDVTDFIDNLKRARGL